MLNLIKRTPTVRPLLPNYLGLAAQTTGYVDQPIRPHHPGRIRYQATYWFGICNGNVRSLPRGTEVNILGRQGNTLIVEPAVQSCPLISS